MIRKLAQHKLLAGTIYRYTGLTQLIGRPELMAIDQVPTFCQLDRSITKTLTYEKEPTCSSGIRLAVHKLFRS